MIDLELQVSNVALHKYGSWDIQPNLLPLVRACLALDQGLLLLQILL